MEDRLEKEELPFTIARNRALWRVVPQKVAYDYTPSRYHEEMQSLTQAGAVTNSLFYRRDRSPRRLFRLWKNQLGHFVKFRKYYHKPNED